MKTKLNAKKMQALNDQVVRKFDSEFHRLSLTNSGTRRLKVRVGGGNLGGFNIAMKIIKWVKEFNMDASYLGRTRGRLGGHVLEVRS